MCWALLLLATLWFFMCLIMVKSIVEGGTHWTRGVGQGMGGYLAQKNYHPQPRWWCKVHSGVVKYSNRALQGILLYMQPNLSSHLKLVWYPVLIMELFILIFSFLWDIMELILDVQNWFNKIGNLVGFILNMCRLCLGSCKG